MPSTREQYEHALTLLERLRTARTVTLASECLEGVLDKLENMLGGDPWQEGEYAVDLLGLLEAAHIDAEVAPS